MSKAMRIMFNILIGVLVTISAAVVILSFAGTILLQQTINEQQEVLACQITYNQDFREAVLARDAAVVAVIGSVFDNGGVESALSDYRETIRENPLPPVDSCNR